MKAIIFDLDNTLYDVKQYYLGAFKKISEYLSKRYNILNQEIYKRLINHWKKKTSMYPHLFNDVLNFFDLGHELKNIIEIFNNYDGELKPYSDVIPTLNKLKKKNYKLGIITDGQVRRQKRKIKLLGLNEIFDIIIFTKELKNPKPSKIPFQEAINKLKINPQYSFYVGDNPLIDFKGAKKAGMKTVRLLKGEFKNMPKNKFVDYEIMEFEELLEVVK